MLWLHCCPTIAPFYAEGIPKMNVLGLSLGEVGPGMWMEMGPLEAKNSADVSLNGRLGIED